MFFISCVLRDAIMPKHNPVRESLKYVISSGSILPPSIFDVFTEQLAKKAMQISANIFFIIKNLSFCKNKHYFIEKKMISQTTFLNELRFIISNSTSIGSLPS